MIHVCAWPALRRKTAAVAAALTVLVAVSAESCEQPPPCKDGSTRYQSTDSQSYVCKDGRWVPRSTRA